MSVTHQIVFDTNCRATIVVDRGKMTIALYRENKGVGKIAIDTGVTKYDENDKPIEFPDSGRIIISGISDFFSVERESAVQSIISGNHS